MEELLRRYSAELRIRLDDAEVEALVKFAELIAKWNRITNLVASSLPAELIHRHIVDCLAVTPFLSGPRIVDVGSGAGLPGIVLAIMHPDSDVTLVESHQRKSRFLRQAAIELGLGNVTVVARRIEDWRAGQPVDCAVSRGYGSLSKFFDDTRALHRDGCRLVAMKGAEPTAEIVGLALAQAAVSVQLLTVPGWEHRHLVTIDCGKLE
ncbi:MAG TPA: 16S rRNA (guanine(527)-N(7))-methyltransferase RsmG [Gammaproteobacteria bacterium]|jgi:16S rRNA (guanine527-N7)-methyltransferase|nr:16S rRNA (guanine(527)-N(7))-methyltransferase RsmG [Gammaproteobacteria bacterium]